MLDTAAPSLARACDHLLGGVNCFAADRSLARQLTDRHPGLAGQLAASRQYTARQVTRAAREGVNQYLDLCSGLPTRPATHQAARAVLPGCRVAYVDRDPGVTEHGRALVPAGVRYVQGDLAEPEAILTRPDLAGFLDFSRPVCLVLALALPVLDLGTARSVVGVLVRAAAPGSYLVVTAPAQGAGGLPESVWPDGLAAAGLGAFFAGLDLTPPGVTEPGPEGPASERGTAGPATRPGAIVAATGVKPAAGAGAPRR